MSFLGRTWCILQLSIWLTVLCATRSSNIFAGAFELPFWSRCSVRPGVKLLVGTPTYQTHLQILKREREHENSIHICTRVSHEGIRGCSTIHRNCRSKVGPLHIHVGAFVSEFLVRRGVGIGYLLFATSAGLLSEKRWKTISQNGVGILITLAFASILSNVGIVPAVHPGYDLAWTAFLPASLAFLLLASTQKSDADKILSVPIAKKSNTFEVGANGDDGTLQSLRRVGIAFVFASLASVLGCMWAFYSCTGYGRNKRYWWKLPSKFCLPPHLTALVAGCMCASYIGGSVNLFSTAHFIFSTMPETYNKKAGSEVLSAMTASDLVTMALYFAVLTWLSGSKDLSSFFGYNTETNSPVFEKVSGNVAASDPATLETAEKHSRGTPNNQMSTFLHEAVIATLLILVVSVSVQLANHIERVVSLPGTATAATTAFSAMLSYAIFRLKRSTRLVSEGMPEVVSKISSQLSMLCYHVFFASLGFSANVVQTTSQYGLPILAFCTMALSIHVGITGILAWGWNELLKCLPSKDSQKKNLTLALLDILVASNAAIGGPATAATFASNISIGESSGRQRGLVLAATFWGIVGYAVGTTVGVYITKLMLSNWSLI